MSEFDILPKEEAFFIWRCESFKIVPWPQENYGEFFSGDSYLVYKAVKRGKLVYRDIYFWIGAESSQDEYGTVAIKAVELDDYFEGFPIQHREVEGHESAKYHSLFEQVGGVRYLNGGVDSGFKTVDRSSKTQLFHIKGKTNPSAKEVTPNGSSLNQNDAFILSTPSKYFLWIGKTANPFEKMKANRILNDFTTKKKLPFERLDDGETTPEFWSFLGGEVPIKVDGGSDADHEASNVLKIHKYDGDEKFTEIASGDKAKKDLLKGSVFIVSRGTNILVWIPKGSKEGRRSILIGIEFLKFAKLPLNQSIETAKEDVQSDELEVLFA